MSTQRQICQLPWVGSGNAVVTLEKHVTFFSDSSPVNAIVSIRWSEVVTMSVSSAGDRDIFITLHPFPYHPRLAL